MPNRLAPSTGPNAPGFWLPQALIRGGTAKAATVMSKPSTMITRNDTTTSWKLKALSLRLSMKSVTSVVCCELMRLPPMCRRLDPRSAQILARSPHGAKRNAGRRSRISRSLSLGLPKARPEGFIRATALLPLRPRAAHDVRPLGFFPVDVGGVFVRAHAHDLGAVGGDARLRVGRRDRGAQRRR